MTNSLALIRQLDASLPTHKIKQERTKTRRERRKAQRDRLKNIKSIKEKIG